MKSPAPPGKGELKKLHLTTPFNETVPLPSLLFSTFLKYIFSIMFPGKIHKSLQISEL